MSTTDKAEKYLQERLEQYYSWYDSKAVASKARYLWIRSVSAVASVLIPVVSNVELSFAAWGSDVDLGNLIVSGLGVAVASLMALEGVYHHREQWKNSRSTAEYLRSQRVLYEHRAEDYFGLDDARAFAQLIGRVERAIAEENAVTLSVLTRTEQKSETAE